MFAQMRSAIGISQGTDILDHIYTLSLGDQDIAMEKIRAIEREAMSLQAPQPGKLVCISIKHCLFLQELGAQGIFVFSTALRELPSSQPPRKRYEVIVLTYLTGLVTLMNYLESKSIPKGICTRNFETPVIHLLGKFLEGNSFSPIVTRDFRPPKPDPAGILHIAKSWGFVGKDGGVGYAKDMIMVGYAI
jgi:hypothetical protein